MEITRQKIRDWSRAGSSIAFGEAALSVAAEDPSVVLLTADLPSFAGWQGHGSGLPERCFNVGIAEQNLVGVACGMAREGMVPFAASYATFASGRCYDQVRVGMGYMGLPVKLVGMAAGFSIGVLGATHMALDDIAMMRAVPGMTILSPADCLETVKATQAAAQIDGPVYIRLTGGLPNPAVYKEDYRFEVGTSVALRVGADACLVATGSMVAESLRAAKRLAEVGIDAGVVDMHTIAPLDGKALDEIASSGVGLVVTVEEHYAQGGLGSAVLEHYAESGAGMRVLRIGAPARFHHAAGYQDLLVQAGLNADGIASRVAEDFRRATGSGRLPL